MVGDVEVDVRDAVRRRDGALDDVAGSSGTARRTCSRTGRRWRARRAATPRSVGARRTTSVPGDQGREVDVGRGDEHGGAGELDVPVGQDASRGRSRPARRPARRRARRRRPTCGPRAPRRTHPSRRTGSRPTPRSCTRMRTRPTSDPSGASCSPSGTTSSTLVPCGGTGVTCGAAREVGGGQLVLVAEREHHVRVADVDAQSRRGRRRARRRRTSASAPSRTACVAARQVPAAHVDGVPDVVADAGRHRDPADAAHARARAERELAVGRVPQAEALQVGGEHPDAVAAHLRDRAVGVAVVHEPARAPAPRPAPRRPRAGARWRRPG